MAHMAFGEKASSGVTVSESNGSNGREGKLGLT